MSKQLAENIDWFWRTFDELSNVEMYGILALRQQVFVLDQQCLNLDVDGHDREALNLLECAGKPSLKEDRARQILAYARLLLPSTR